MDEQVIFICTACKRWCNHIERSAQDIIIGDGVSCILGLIEQASVVNSSSSFFIIELNAAG